VIILLHCDNPVHSEKQKNSRRLTTRMDSTSFQVFSGLVKRRGFFWQSFEIYGGSAGFFDYGPNGAAMKNNIENLWRRYFVTEEGFAEIDTPVIKIKQVFEASGHLAKFTDVLVRCTSSKCGESFRADHLIVDLHPNPDSLNADEITTIIERNNVNCPRCGAALGKCYDFNLMFSTKVGSDGEGFLQPETAQGIFINFSPLYRHFREKLPFGVVQIGKGFRNEISPRQGIIRLRELNMAEAEIFYNPGIPGHADRFPLDTSSDAPRMTLVDAGEKEHFMSVNQAHREGIIENPILAYFIDRTHRFMVAAGCDPGRLRFRQHQATEMAHYARDCWDAEALLSFPASPGNSEVREVWIEITGIADRACYDLEMHMKRSGKDMRAMERFDEPVNTKGWVIVPDLKDMGPVYRGDVKDIAAVIEELNDPGTRGPSTDGAGMLPHTRERIVTEKGLRLTLPDGRELEIPDTFFRLEEKEFKIPGKRYLPHVIEPSFGIDRILYTVLQHSFTYDPGEEYSVCHFPAAIAPVQAGIMPLMGKPPLEEPARRTERVLRRAGFAVRYDDNGSIGRRYARMDEIGTPYCITIDYEDAENNTVTIRERSSRQQKKIDVDSLPATLERLFSGKISFGDSWGSRI